MPPLNPALMQMLAGLGGAAGPGPGPAAGPPPGPGMGMPSMGGGPPGGAPAPMGLDNLGQEGMDALDGIVNSQPSGEARLERVRTGLDVAHKIILACLPLVGTENMDMAKQLHVLGRQLADTRMNLSKENEAGMPPEAMLGGIQGTGLPGPRF